MRSSRKKSESGNGITRRAFGRQIGSAWAALALPARQETDRFASFPVAISKETNRSISIPTAVAALGEISFEGRTVYLKGNYNSPHPCPASTHPDALSAIVRILRDCKCGKIILAERSGMGVTEEIWRKLQIGELAKDLDIQLLPLDKPDVVLWRRVDLSGSHWKRGVEAPDFLGPDTPIVQICNLKSHRFGGHFSASLKNSLGLIAKHDSQEPQYNYMVELHGSRFQRMMIAEVNQLYTPALIVMDATEVFVTRGPEEGDRAFPHLVAASRDRVAIDAVGAAILRLSGAGPLLQRGDIFELEQIKRAAELKLGAGSADQIELLPANTAARLAASQIKTVLQSATREKQNKPPASF